LKLYAFGAELPAWPAACQAPGGLAGQAPVQAEFWKIWPGLIRPTNMPAWLQARPGQNSWPG